MELRNLIEAHLDLPRLAKDLDEIAHPGRAWAVHQWSHANMAALWEAARGFRAITLDHLVPPSLPPLGESVHDGKSSLPFFSHFRKVFCKPSDAAASETMAFGFNQSPLCALTGPGYCVAHPSAEPGEVEIDYAMLPNEKPPHWPPIVPSSARLGRFVYGETIDVVRGISSHVSIGRAKKRQSLIDRWFVLLREDPHASRAM